jgi:hypothetical protein
MHMIFLKIKKFVLLILILWFNLFFTNAQQKNATLSGYVKDANTGEELISANVYIHEIKAGASTNTYGFYSLTIPKGKYHLSVTCLGYISQEIEIEISESKSLNIQMQPAENLINEVNVTAEKKDQNTRGNEMSMNKLQMKTIAKIPALMGEVDVLRSIQFLPGVQSSGEGSIGFYVRGGGVDQNLIILDEATVYNASHIGGIFSVFNQDAIREVTLFKGGIPSIYGGRLSSILDIRMKEGSSKKIRATGGIGVVSSRLTLEAPLIKEKASFVISGRRTYFDQFFPLFRDSVVQQSKAYFYDLNAKINYLINENNRIFISGYFGKDVFQIGNSIRVNYGNQTFTARFNHLFSKKIFSNISFIYSVFQYGMGVPEGIQSFDWQSGINDLSLKNDYTLYLNPKNTIRFGAQITHHTFNPGKAIPVGDQSIFSGRELPKVYALESAIFIENELVITDKISTRYGFRFSLFNNLGPYTGYIFDKSNPKKYSVRDSLVYAGNELFNFQKGIEPRINLKIEIDNLSSIKLSYNRMFQYLHLTSNTMSTTPLDLWFPSTPNIKPQMADQYSIGYFRNFFDDMLETSMEIYYKKMKNSIDFADHAQLLLNKYMEGELRMGTSDAYGFELLVKKQTGKITGWFSYTFSKVYRKIPEINDGIKYQAHYDKPHDISFIFSYDLNNSVNLSLNWVYSTGAPRTMPTGRFEYEGMIVPVYSSRNSVRLPDYHRMDAAVTWNFRKTKENGEPKKYTSSLNFSVYNLYNRHNAYSITFNQSATDPYRTEATKFYLFRIIPTITYNFTINQ